jgi:hypothetical protein
MLTVANIRNKTQNLKINDKLISCKRIKTTIQFKGILKKFIIVDRAVSIIKKMNELILCNLKNYKYLNLTWY